MPRSHTQFAELKTILIVDDTPDNLTILGELLMPHYDVKIANNGQRALIAAEQYPAPDLILLDIMMPEMDGHEVLRCLKANPKTQAIPVIFISALNEEHDETQGLTLGAVDYITKPIKPAIALARVKAQLELKAARDLLQNSNAWLEHEIARRMRQNQMIQDVSIRALAKLAEVRDNETGNHILRTQAYVRILAEELAKHPDHGKVLTAENVNLYSKASPLHDIGKVGIPDHILHKPGKHTPEEWAVMKTHAEIGANAIWEAIQNEPDQDGLSFLHVAMEIAAHHHEKWDGSGYPKGLAGTDIPFAARIMALADVMDALLSKRIYKPPFTFEQATAIILEGKASHFDPDVVDAFSRRLDDFAAIATRFQDNN